MKNISNIIINFNDLSLGFYIGNTRYFENGKNFRIIAIEVHLFFIHLRIGIMKYERRE